MKHIKWWSLALVTLIIATLACGGGGRTPTTVPPTSVPPTSAPPTPQPTQVRPTATPEEETGFLEIINNSSVDIYYVYISPSDSDEWGEDWLGDDIVPAGERYTITGIPFGTYDLRADDADGNELVTEMGVEIDGEMTWTLSDVGGGEGEEISQWATDATASSEYSNPDWAAIQATGAPDTDECGDLSTAWASAHSDTEDWIELTYRTPVYVTGINIYQTYHPDQVVKVELIDLTSEYHVVYQGRPREVECPYVLSIGVDNVDYLAAGLRITIDQSVLGLGWNEIDAVEVIGIPE